MHVACLQCPNDKRADILLLGTTEPQPNLWVQETSCAFVTAKPVFLILGKIILISYI